MAVHPQNWVRFFGMGGITEAQKNFLSQSVMHAGGEKTLASELAGMSFARTVWGSRP